MGPAVQRVKVRELIEKKLTAVKHYEEFVTELKIQHLALVTYLKTLDQQIEEEQKNG